MRGLKNAKKGRFPPKIALRLKKYSETRGDVTGLLLLPSIYASMLAVAHARVRYRINRASELISLFHLSSSLFFG